MDVPWYKLAKEGDKERLLKLVEESPHILESVTPLNETALHVALRYKHRDLAEKLATSHPLLVEKLNAKGDTPLHLALLMEHTRFLVSWLSDIPGSVLESGNNFINKAGKSLLFLAVETGSPEAVEALLQSPLGKECGGPNKLTALHAAVFQHRRPNFETQAKEIIKALLSCPLKLSREKDDLGNTPMHYAVTLGNKGLDLVKSLLQYDIHAAYILNKEGLSPLHLAASLGLVGVFRCFMELCPESGLATTENGRNVLHISVQKHRLAMVRHILERSELRILINEKDGDGNTPFHLSMLLRYASIQRLLKRSKKLDKHAWNNEGVTCGDIDKITEKLQLNGLSDPTCLSIMKVNSKNGLSSATYLPGALANSDLGGIAQMKYETIVTGIFNTSWKEKVKDVKECANVMLVVATLITAVTFAAAFTIPGGYNDSEPDKGIATLAKHPALKVFLLFDTLSLCASTLAIILIVLSAFWALLLPHPCMMVWIIPIAKLFILLAVQLMLWAFTSGLYLVLESQLLAISIGAIVNATFLTTGLYYFELIHGFKHTEEAYRKLLLFLTYLEKTLSTFFKR